MSRLEAVANVVLRVPCVLLLDLLYRWDPEDTPHPAYSPAPLHPTLLWGLYCLGHVTCAVLVTLPLRYLVNTYLYLLTSLLLYVAHRTARDSLAHAQSSRHWGALFEEEASVTRSISTLTGLVMVCSLCSLLMRTRQAWLFSAPVLPVLARLAGLPLLSLPLLITLSTGLTLLVMSYAALSGLGTLCRFLSHTYQELTQDLELSRLVALAMGLWTRLAVSALFLVFWLVLFLLHIYKTLSSKPETLEQQGALFILLNSVAECCVTPYCLVGLSCAVSYAALGLLSLCKFYLLGFAAFQNGNVMHRGVTEGVTLLLLSLQTGLLELQTLQRTFLLSIILFIVATSTLQSMIEITDPVLLGLAATHNRSVWKHLRGLSLGLFLLLFPSFMAYEIAYFFHMDFWLLILVSSCLLTSLQVVGTLFIYSLFMIELLQESRVERMDEIIFGVNAVSRVLEFLVAVSVVAYGAWESLFGEWSWMGVSVIIVHSYFNVWLRAQSGWMSFLLRRKAAKKIGSLPHATEEQLRAHNDVCSICYQEMSGGAVITTCGHFFHGDCLKKWLYVQDTCPLCHQPVRAEDRDTEEEEEVEEEEILELRDGSGIPLGGGSGPRDGAEAEVLVTKNMSVHPGVNEVPAMAVDHALYTQAGDGLHQPEDEDISPIMKKVRQEEVMNPGHERKRQEGLYKVEVHCTEELTQDISLREPPFRQQKSHPREENYLRSERNLDQEDQNMAPHMKPEEDLDWEKDKNHPREEKSDRPDMDLYWKDQSVALHREAEEHLDQEEEKSHSREETYHRPEKYLYRKDQSVVPHGKTEEYLDWTRDTRMSVEEQNIHEEMDRVVFREGGEVSRDDLLREEEGGHS